MTKYICIGIINISQSMLMFTIVFGIQFYLFDWKSIDFFFCFKRKKLKTRLIGRAPLMIFSRERYRTHKLSRPRFNYWVYSRWQGWFLRYKDTDSTYLFIRWRELGVPKKVFCFYKRKKRTYQLMKPTFRKSSFKKELPLTLSKFIILHHDFC